MMEDASASRVSSTPAFGRGVVHQRWPRLDGASVVSDFQRRLAGVQDWLEAGANTITRSVEAGKGSIAQSIERIGKRERGGVNGGQFDHLWMTLSGFGAHLQRARSELVLNQGARRQPLLAAMSLGVAEGKHMFDIAMSGEQVAKRLDGVPVYTVSNSANEFVLVSDLNTSKSLGIFCFREVDAQALLSQVRDREPSLGRGAKVVAVSLDKVYQLSTEGIAFRFLPDPRQVKNALETRFKAGEAGKAFDGVPVFQSDNLILRSNNRRFCPIFFSKEDLENALQRAFKQQQRVNPALKVNTDIQVGSFEDVLKRMEGNEEESGWSDIVFIPPGIDAFKHLSKYQGTVLG